jgi:predicted lipid-binding transport protein (Tim44 family)
MQISASTLLASQQARAAAPAARQPANGDQSFEPMQFAPAAKTATPPAQAAFQPPGSQVDIKV